MYGDKSEWRVCGWCARVHLCVLACVASMCLLVAESKRGV